MTREEEDQVSMNKTLVLLGGEDPEDHKFIRMKAVTRLTQVAEKDTDVNKMENNNVSIRRRWREEEEMQRCCNVLVLAESMAKKRDKRKTKKKGKFCKISMPYMPNVSYPYPRMHSWLAILVEKPTLNYWGWVGTTASTRWNRHYHFWTRHHH